MFWSDILECYSEVLFWSAILKSYSNMDRAKEKGKVPQKDPIGHEMFKCMTARDLTMESFPIYTEQTGNHSSGTGLHDIDFVGRLCYWEDFRQNVLKVFTSTSWNDHPDILSLRLRSNSLNSLGYEHFRCGAEISTNGRYAHHVLHVMTAVARELGYDLAFGDWSVTPDSIKWSQSNPSTSTEKQKRSVPDYALIDIHTSKPHALGEGKHPWGTLPERLVEGTRSGEQDREKRFRHFLGEFYHFCTHSAPDINLSVGQLARDMWASNLRFGFMSNFKYTIFVRRELVDQKWTLFYSDAIPYTAQSVLSQGSVTEVSARECMLHILEAVSKESSNWSLPAEKREPIEKWVYIKERDNPEEKPQMTLAAGAKISQELQSKRGILKDKSPTLTETARTTSSAISSRVMEPSQADPAERRTVISSRQSSESAGDSDTRLELPTRPHHPGLRSAGQLHERQQATGEREEPSEIRARDSTSQRRSRRPEHGKEDPKSSKDQRHHQKR